MEAADPGSAPNLGGDAERTPFRAFIDLVASDPALQDGLAEIDVPEVYAAAAVALAERSGIVLSEEEVLSALGPDPGPPGIGRRSSAPMAFDRWPGRHWLPARAVPGAAAPMFDWAWFGPEPLCHPFYEDSVRHVLHRPFNRMFRTRTSLAALIDGARPEAVPPAGFLFHMSRCGSTLAARMLAASDRHVVLSEPEPLDALVRWVLLAGISPSEQVRALRAMIAALGRDRSGRASRLFVKLDTWHTLALPLFRKAFPDVPWIFLYRDPVEVMASQMHQTSVHCVAGTLPERLTGIRAAEALPPDVYCARLLARTARAVLDHWALGGGMLVNYRDLPDAMYDRVPRHFGMVPDTAAADAMRGVASRDAKTPETAFGPDSERKRATIGADARMAATAHLQPVHLALEALRMGRE